jgi:hypothetical protein
LLHFFATTVVFGIFLPNACANVRASRMVRQALEHTHHGRSDNNVRVVAFLATDAPTGGEGTLDQRTNAMGHHGPAWHVASHQSRPKRRAVRYAVADIAAWVAAQRQTGEVA